MLLRRPSSQLILSGAISILLSCKTTDSGSRVAATASDRIYNIVSVGDSYAAGEGNPVFDAYQSLILFRKAQWKRAGSKEELADALRCHRSDNSGHHQAFVRMQPFFRENRIKADYNAFACSGARIDSGLLGYYPGAEPPENISPNPGVTWLNPQLKQVDDYYQEHKPGQSIDVMLISIGGNDFNFAPIIAECVDPLKGDCSKEPTVKSVFEGSDSKVPEMKQKLRDLLTVLSQKELPASTSYVVPNSDGKSMGIPLPYRKMKTKVKKVIFVPYPNLVKGSAGGGQYYCNGSIPENGGIADWFTPEAILPDWAENITEAESRYVETKALAAINSVINDVVAENRSDLKVTIVNSVTNRFQGHGICSNAARRWINTNMDAEERQGKAMLLWPASWSIRPFFVPGVSTGFVHPNNLGYQAIADEILKVLEPIVEEDFAKSMQVAKDAKEAAKAKAKAKAKDVQIAAVEAQAKKIAAQKAVELQKKITTLKKNSPELEKLVTQLQQEVALVRGTAEDDESPAELPED